jgi:hypothetical protein
MGVQGRLWKGSSNVQRKMKVLLLGGPSDVEMFESRLHVAIERRLLRGRTNSVFGDDTHGEVL